MEGTAEEEEAVAMTDNLVVAVDASNVEKKVISPGNAQMLLKEVIFKIFVIYMQFRMAWVELFFRCAQAKKSDVDLGWIRERHAVSLKS